MIIVHIWSFSGPRFPTFGLDTERYSVFLRIQSERTRETSNTDIFHAVYIKTFIPEIRLISFMRLDGQKYIQCVKSSWSVLHLYLKIRVLPFL